MIMNFSFTVIARCKKYDKAENYIAKTETKEDLELTFDLETAQKFLLRFYSNGLKINEYKLTFKTDENGNFHGIVLYKDNYIYIVTNINQLISDVLKGYNYLIGIDKVADILEFDFKAGLEFSSNEIEDEFGE